MAKDNNVIAAELGETVGQYTLVYNNSGSIEVVTGPTVLPLGATQATSGVSGDNVDIHFGRRIKVTCDDTVALGDPLMAAANGEVEPYSAAAGVYCLGYALEAGSAGEVIEMAYCPVTLPDPTT